MNMFNIKDDVYDVLKVRLPKEILEYIDKVLLDYQQYSAKYDDGVKDIIGEYCDKYGNYEIIAWEHEMVSTDELIHYLENKFRFVKYVKCIIEYDDDKTREEIIIKTTNGYKSESEDEKIFFYGLSEKEIENAIKNKTLIENEWRIIKIVERLEEL